MELKMPKSEKYQWTQHSIYKMRQYGLSPQRVVRVIRNPERTEVGIVENTIAVMQPSSTRFKNGKRTWSQEIWAMYQIKKVKSQKSNVKSEISIRQLADQILNSANRKIRIISAWRYPGVSPKNNPIPEEILREISGII